MCYTWGQHGVQERSVLLFLVQHVRNPFEYTYLLWLNGVISEFFAWQLQWPGMGPFVQLSESEHGMEVFDAVARARRWYEQERRERALPEKEQWEFDQWHAKQPDS